MKLVLRMIIFVGVLLLLNIQIVIAQSDDPIDQEPYAGEALCMPDTYLQKPTDCLLLGPSAYLSDLAKSGIILPPPPLAVYSAPVEYSVVPYEYLKVTTKSAISVYNSVLDAAGKYVARTIGYGFRYLSIQQRSESEYGIYYQFGTGEWVWGGDVSRVSPPVFSGYIFRQNPKLSFGWILEDTESKKTPGTDGINTGHQLKRFDVFYVYQTTRIGEVDWYLIAPDEWIEMRYFSKANFNPLSPQGVDNGRWIEIDLQQQVLMVYDQGNLIFATLVSTGAKPFYTQPGLFKIYKKLEKEYMSYGDPSDYYYLEDVPWTMYFDQSRALHGAYWHSFFGYPRSHGCVNLSISDSRWLYNWAQEGDYVYVWDPSGQTPTDPAYYINSGGP